MLEDLVLAAVTRRRPAPARSTRRRCASSPEAFRSPSTFRGCNAVDPMSLIERLTDEFARLPGIGRKTALRLTYHVLRIPPTDAHRLAEAIVAVSERIRPCDLCGSYTESSPCSICSNPRRDRSIICVVEEASDIGPIEATGEYRGLYHVLGGRLSPLDGVGPAELNIESPHAEVGARRSRRRGRPGHESQRRR
jgi:recombinational DNA repair protein RecR